MSTKQRLTLGGAGLLLVVLLLAAGRTLSWAQERAPRREIAQLLADLEAAGVSAELEAVTAASPPPEGDMLAALAAVPDLGGAEVDALVQADEEALLGRCVRGRLSAGDGGEPALATLEAWTARAAAAARRALAARGPAIVLDEHGQLAELPEGLQATLSNAVTALEIESGLAARAGRGDAAWASLADMGELVSRVTWPTVSGRLIVDARRKVLAERVAVTLWRCGLPGDPGTHRRRLERLEDLEGLTLAHRGELARVLRISRRLVEEGPDALPELQRAPADVRLVFTRALFLSDQALLLRIHGPVVQAAASGRLDELLAATGAAADARHAVVEVKYPVTQLHGHHPEKSVVPMLSAVALLRMARAALVLGVAAGDGELPEALPRDAALSDPFAVPPAPLRWRRTGPRSGLLWSVGPEGQDDGRDLPADPTATGPDWAYQVVRLEVRLPGAR